MATMSDDARQRFLSEVPFFSGCTAEQVREISRLSEERPITAGTELCRQDDFENEVYVIVEGDAEVVVDGASVGKTHAGEIVGELAMLGNGRRAATLRALEAMRVLVLDAREVDSVLAADPSSMRRLDEHGGEGKG
jgi:voltage-gated potassium channel